jgi:glutamate carboxypeptidase
LVEHFASKLPAMLADLESLINCESPSADLAAVARSAALVSDIGTRLLGAEPEMLVIDDCTHLRWRLGTGDRRVLVLAHHDTVWPIGSLATHPYGVQDGVLRGPGSFDMLVGLVMAFYALAVFEAHPPVTVLVTGDEEIGSTTSRELIETEAADCVAALVLEPSADGGALKVRRKGTSWYRLGVRGRAAHAGLEPEKGINAGVEMAHQVLAVAALGAPAEGTTVVPTVLSAGTTPNTIPAFAQITVDVRAWSLAEQLRVDEAIRAMAPVDAEASLNIDGGPNRPPLDRDASAALLALAQRLAGALELEPLRSAEVGGGSDGNFTAGAGTPTLDGLGAVGGGAHADHEHALVAAIPERTALLAALVDHLIRNPPESWAVE